MTIGVVHAWSAIVIAYTTSCTWHCYCINTHAKFFGRNCGLFWEWKSFEAYFVDEEKSVFVFDKKQPVSN